MHYCEVERSILNNRKSFFCTRVVDKWNDLLEKVISGDNVLHFEKSLNKVRRNQELKFNLKTKINKLNVHLW